jgi:DNA modification methylase
MPRTATAKKIDAILEEVDTVQKLDPPPKKCTKAVIASDPALMADMESRAEQRPKPQRHTAKKSTAGEVVNVVQGDVPADYHAANAKYTQPYLGELRKADGGYYSRLDRRHYYSDVERGKGGHIAKTPLHIARWAIQQFTKPGQWVLDPTIGAGTSAVEAISQGRNVAGMELEFTHVVQANVEKALADFPGKVEARIGFGDARTLGDFLGKDSPKFHLLVNNPPYSGDVSMPSPKGKLRGKEHRALETRFDYNKELPNLAFLKEGQEYWDTMRAIYNEGLKRLVPGGHVVIGVKDMMRNRVPFLLHEGFCDLLADMGLEFVGTYLLKHIPATLFLNTYEQFYGVKPPFYQTISVFRKPTGWKAVTASRAQVVPNSPIPADEPKKEEAMPRKKADAPVAKKASAAKAAKKAPVAKKAAAKKVSKK